MKRILMVIMLVGIFGLGGCIKPYNVPEFVTVGSEETAFVIPLIGENKENQVKFESVKYVEQMKVASKRIAIPHIWRSTGRFQWMGTWDDAVAVYKVKRTPLSREWLQNPAQGTSNNDDSFKFESADSVTFYVGGTLQALVEEKSSAKFFYYYRETGLGKIADRDIRPYMAKILVREFGRMSTEGCRLNKGDVFEIAENEAIKHFKQFGVTITSFGMQGDLTYENRDIQNQINTKAQMELSAKIAIESQKKKVVEAETAKKEALIKEQQSIEIAEKTKEKRLIQEQMDIEIEKKQLEKIKIQNAKDKETADKNLYIAQQQQKVLATTKDLVALEIEKIRANAELEKARRWNGVIPTLVPENAKVMMGLDKTINILDMTK